MHKVQEEMKEKDSKKKNQHNIMLDARSNNHILDVGGPTKSNHARFGNGILAVPGRVKNGKVLLDGEGYGEM